MTKKPLILAFLFSAALLFVASHAAAEDKASAPCAPGQRYVIIQDGSMKFDTATGQTWLRDGGKWVAMPDEEPVVKGAVTPKEDKNDYDICINLAEIRVPVIDLRYSPSFKRLSRVDKARVYHRYFMANHIYDDNAPERAEFYKAVREDLGS